MSLYDTLAATALKLLADKGQPVTLRSFTAGAYDPATSAAVMTQVDVTVMAVVLDFPPGQSLERGALIQVGDLRVLLAATDVNGGAVLVDLTCSVITRGATYKVLSIGEVNPAGTRVLYKLHLRT